MQLVYPFKDCVQSEFMGIFREFMQIDISTQM